MKFASLVLKYRIFIFISIIVLSLFSIPGILRLDITVDVEDYFVEGDDAIKNQKRFEEIFGKNEFFGVLFESDDIFSTPSLEKLHEIGDAITEKISCAQSVYSVTHIDSLVLGSKLFIFNKNGKLIADQKSISQTIEAFLNDPSLVGTLFSENRKEAWIMVPLTFTEKKSTPNEFELGELVYNTISDIDRDESMTITAVGMSVYAHRKQVEMIDDLIKVLLFGGLVAFILCIFIFRSKQTVIATLSLIILAPTMVFGALGWLQIPAESAFISVPILLTMGVCIGNAVHINHFFKSNFIKTGKRKESILYALDHLWKPILFTVITTIAALLSFLSVQVYPIRWVGVVSAACIFMIYILCMFFFPILLSIGRDAKPKAASDKQNLSFELFFNWLSGFISKHPALILIIFILITLAALHGSSRGNIDLNAEKMMGTKLEHMKDQVKIKYSDICSNEFMDLTILGKPGWFKNNTYISNLEALQKDIDSLPLVKKTSSILQITSRANRLFHFRNNFYYSTPKNQESLDNIFNLLERYTINYLREWTTEDYSTTRIFIEMSDFSSKTILQNINHLETLVAKHFPPETEHFLTGSTYQMAMMNQYITKGLINSIIIALGFIVLIMMLFFRSIKLGLVAMFPNVFPVIICGAIVGYAGIPLEFVTMTVAPLILGLAVDDTIHFLSSLKTNITKSNNYNSGIERAYKEVGVAITKTTLILCLTFLVFTISDIKSTSNMGILACAGILSAYLADIFIVPLIIKWIKPFKTGVSA